MYFFGFSVNATIVTDSKPRKYKTFICGCESFIKGRKLAVYYFSQLPIYPFECYFIFRSAFCLGSEDEIILKSHLQ